MTFRRHHLIYFFNSDFKFFDDVSEFSVTSLYVAVISFSLKFTLIFLQSVFYRDYGYNNKYVGLAAVMCHLYLSFLKSEIMKYATRIFVCIIGGSKLQ